MVITDPAPWGRVDAGGTVVDGTGVEELTGPETST
jgi:hypothetical protein